MYRPDVELHILSPTETKLMSEFLNRLECRIALREGGQWALVFGPSTGIGMPVAVTVKHPNGTIYRLDITDVSTW